MNPLQPGSGKNREIVIEILHRKWGSPENFNYDLSVFDLKYVCPKILKIYVSPKMGLSLEIH
jgi:hypothetical protein